MTGRGLSVREVFDVVVVGGGITGCAAGILLVRGGFRVALVEGFPWEWWLDESAEEGSFRNFSGGVLYGVPGSRVVSDLLSGLSLPLSSPRGEGHVSFATMEPALQIVASGRRLNLASSLDESVREIDRVFPGWGSPMRKLCEQARTTGEDLSAPPAGGSGVKRFLDAWAWRWKALSPARRRRAARAASLIPPASPAATICRLVLFALSRRRPGEATAGELLECLRLATTPSCLVNETGQWGVLLALKAAFRKLGGVVYRCDRLPGVSQVSRRRVCLAVGDRHSFETGWLVLDGPEEQLGGGMTPFRSSWRKSALRPVVHHTWRLPTAALPEAMSGHLVLAGEEALPLLVTLSPRGREWTLLETLSTGDRDEHPEAAAAAVKRRLESILPFLPSDVEPRAVRHGWLPSSHGRGGGWGAFGGLGPPLDVSNFRRIGRCLLVGRGDYLGSALNGALYDGRRLASWLLRRTGVR